MDQLESQERPVQPGAAAAGWWRPPHDLKAACDRFPQLRSYLDEEQAQAHKTMVCFVRVRDFAF